MRPSVIEEEDFDLEDFLDEDLAPEHLLKKRTLVLVATDDEWKKFLRDLPSDHRDRYRLLEELFMSSTFVQGI